MRSILLSTLAVSAVLVIAGCSPVEPGEEPEDDASADDGDQSEEDTDEAASELVAWCDDTLNWNSSWTTLENSVITLVNQKRAAGAVCGGVSKPPVPALTKDTRLRCAARKHSKEMGKNNFFSHTGSNGSTFAQRHHEVGLHVAGREVAPKLRGEIVPVLAGDVDRPSGVPASSGGSVRGLPPWRRRTGTAEATPRLRTSGQPRSRRSPRGRSPA